MSPAPSRHAAEPPGLRGAARHAAGLAILAGGGAAASRDAMGLAALVRESVAAEVERLALHLRLSRLGRMLAQAHHHRLVREALEPLLRPVRGQLFELPNGDLVAVAPPQGRHLAEAEAALATILAPEPGEEPPFVTLRLPQQAAALLAAVEESLAAPPPPPPAIGQGAAGFGSAALAALERGLGPVSLGTFLRRRPVCRLLPEAAGPELVWEEWRLDQPALLQALVPGIAPQAAPWLDRRLRRLLDRRLLADLARPAELRALGTALLPLAVASLTEEAFLRLDAALGSQGRRALILGFEAADLLADPAGFLFARDFCRGRGYRLALTEVTAATIRLLPASRLGMDLVLLRWGPELPAGGPALRAALSGATEGVVLTGVERAAAIGWGWEEGINLFQGPLLAPRPRA